MKSATLIALFLATQLHAQERVRVLIQADNPEVAARIQAECEWLSDGSVSSVGIRSALQKVEEEETIWRLTAGGRF